MSEIFHVHSVNYIRTGSCNRCGECCKVKNCLHFSWKEGALGFCDIHDNRIGICTKCTTTEDAYFHKAGREATHQICIDFPNHPFLGVINSGVCGYKFEPATEEDKAKHQKLIEAWQI